MDLSVNVNVHCADGLCGRSTYVLIDPVLEQVTHLVVREAEIPHTELVVPVTQVAGAAPDVILLKCTRKELQAMEPFILTQYVKEDLPDPHADRLAYVGMSSYLLWPYVIPTRTEYVRVEQEQVPPGELAVRRGARVEASDGHLGRVDEFVVNPETGHITHLMMREGHLWGKKDVAIPVSGIDHYEENTVYLKLSKQQIEALPAVPIRRWAA
jgi:sporulation protein YlmC with PRC-barrel domain